MERLWGFRVRDRLEFEGHAMNFTPPGGLTDSRQLGDVLCVAECAMSAPLRSPVRPAWTTAWEAHSLSLLSEGRFEMGIGLGRPGIEDQLRELGLPVVPRASGSPRYVTPSRRYGSSTAPTCIHRS
jgi:hypothetical protein